MEKEEVLFFVALILFIGVLVVERRLHPIPNEDVADVVAPAPVGPTYLTFNAPWRFGPPVQNVLPYSTAGMIGQMADVNADCGCSGAQQKW